MVTTVFNTDINDGYFKGGGVSNWNTVWIDPTGIIYDDLSYLNLGTYKTAQYYTLRVFLFFDTSIISNNMVIDSAVLSLVNWIDNSITDFNVVIQNGQPNYPSNPVVTTDNNKDLYSGNYGSTNTSIITGDGYVFNIILNDYSIITKNGITKILLRNDNDIAGIAPIIFLDEYVRFYSYDAGIENCPKLTVTYHLPTSPNDMSANILDDRNISQISNESRNVSNVSNESRNVKIEME